MLDQIDLIVRDVPAAAALFRDVLELEIRVNEERFAEIDAGGFTIMLSPEAMVPTAPAQGVILHFQVDDVAQALANARDRGTTVLQDVTRTDWGWESAMIQGPEAVIIDFYRQIEAQSE